MRKAIFPGYLITVLLLQSCSDNTEPSPDQSAPNGVTAAAELEGTAWELAEMTVLGGYSFTPDQPDKYTVEFRTDNRLTGKSDCNTFTGHWSHEDTFAISQFSASRSMCISGSLHNYYSLYLRDVNGYERAGNQLVLNTPIEEVRLVFSASER